MRRAALLALLLAAVAGCSAVEEKRKAYLQADNLPPLEIPEGLDAPDTRQALMVPERAPYTVPDAAPPALEGD